MSHFELNIAPSFLRNSASVTATINERRVLDLVRRSGDVSRAELTRATDLTAQSISRIVEGLEARGLVQMGERVINGRGQPSVQVRLAADALYTVGVSIMTDAVGVALTNFAGQVVEERRTTIEPMARDVVLDRIDADLADMLARNQVDRSRLFGVGVGVSGYFVGERGQVNPPEPLEDWALMDLEPIFAERIGAPVWIDNDGNAAAVGESLFGVGQWAPTFAYLFFTNGLGGGVVVNGEPLRGACGNAGEFAGILPLERLSERPTLELLRQMVVERGVEIENVQELVDRFDPQWPGVEAWIERARRPMSEIASAIFSVLDPHAIVLGGRMPKQLAELLISHIEFFNLPRRARPRPTPRVVASETSGDATALGAAAIPLKAHFFV